MVGYSVAYIPGGMFLAAACGVYGVGFLLVMAVATFYVIQQGVSYKKILPPLFGVLVVLFLLSLTQNERPLVTNVYTINTSLSIAKQTGVEGQQHKLAVLNEALKSIKTTEDAVVILPEDSRYFILNGNGDVLSGIRQYRFTAGTTSFTVIDSGRTETENGAVLRAYEYDSLSHKILVADKQYLVPQGEYMPWLYGTIFRLLGYGATVSEMRGRLYVRGEIDETQTAILFCFESVNPLGVKRVVRKESDFIAHPLSHAWFHGSKLFERQLDTMLLLQARASGVSIISAANEASGKRYTPKGTIDDGVLVAAGIDWEVRYYEPSLP
jgi:apolipoprotein N-acyltransferase